MSRRGARPPARARARADGPTDAIRRELWELIIRYKTTLAQGEVFRIEEREGDRRYLHSITSDLATTTHRILDSKAYLQLSTMQEEAGRKFLAAGTSPATRFKMLARVVGALASPIVFVGGRSNLAYAPFERAADEVAGEDVEHAEDSRIELPPARIHSRPVDERELEAARTRLTAAAGDAETLDELTGSITMLEAELLSQLASSGQLCLPIDPTGLDPDDEHASVSLVLKSD